MECGKIGLEQTRMRSLPACPPVAPGTLKDVHGASQGAVRLGRPAPDIFAPGSRQRCFGPDTYTGEVTVKRLIGDRV